MAGSTAAIKFLDCDVAILQREIPLQDSQQK
jgi:hypothetical protein